jgi:hypothetical protein
MKGKRCNGTNRAGEPCRLPPITGGTVCRMHGGASPQARAAAARRVAEAEAAKEMGRAMVTLGVQDRDIDPAKALLEEISWTYAHVAWLRAKVRELKPAELVWGVTQTDNGVGPQGPVDMTTEKSAPNVWYSLYMTEREHLVKVSAAALRAGVEERRIKIAEDQGNMVAAVLQRILAALNLSPEQWAEVPTIVPRELRALAVE